MSSQETASGAPQQAIGYLRPVAPTLCPSGKLKHDDKFTVCVDFIAGSKPVDPEAIAFLVDDQGVCRTVADFIYWDNKQGAGILHEGEIGQSIYDTERIFVSLEHIPAHVQKIVFALTTGLSSERLGRLELAHLSLRFGFQQVNCADYAGADMTTARVWQLATLTRERQDWTFSVDSQRLPGSLETVCARFNLPT